MNRREAFDMPDDRRLFRDRLVARMQEQKITGAELARQARLSVDAISTYTTMRSKPTPKTLERLAKVLNCKPADLLPVNPVRESLLEIRDTHDRSQKMLIAKIVLPVEEALAAFASLAKLETRIRNSRIEKTP